MEEPTFLSKKNAHQRDAHISFDEGPHIYTIDGDSDYMSVTSWNSTHFPKFDADSVISKMMDSPRWPQSPYFGMTREEIKMKWKNDGNEASVAGTNMHYNIECFYNGIDVEDDGSLEWKYFREFNEAVGKNLTPYRTEWMVWDKELRLAGSVDMLFENPDGTLQIYDWKRSKKVVKENKWASAIVDCISHLPDANFWKYSLQLNTYKWILEKNYDKKISNMFLVWLHPNNSGNSYLRYEVDSLPKEMEDLVKLRMRHTNSGEVSNPFVDTSTMTANQASETVDKLVELKNKKKEYISDMDAMLETLENKLISYSKESGHNSVNGKDYKVTFREDSNFKVPEKKDLRRYELESTLKELNLW
ncbi:MAG: PD-(D/E)XK nuclease family protein, partial [Candidatus Thermoplasmatota archaeon]|nr:PD-(D/E)XK nuclease family protein [Candidatus Thermoplasmatota archaeon]